MLVTGNMWSQEWNNIYSLLQPYTNRTALDVTSAMQNQVCPASPGTAWCSNNTTTECLAHYANSTAVRCNAITSLAVGLAGLSYNTIINNSLFEPSCQSQTFPAYLYFSSASHSSCFCSRFFLSFFFLSSLLSVFLTFFLSFILSIPSLFS